MRTTWTSPCVRSCGRAVAVAKLDSAARSRDGRRTRKPAAILGPACSPLGRAASTQRPQVLRAARGQNPNLRSHHDLPPHAFHPFDEFYSDLRRRARPTFTSREQQCFDAVRGPTLRVREPPPFTRREQGMDPRHTLQSHQVFIIWHQQVRWDSPDPASEPPS